MTRYYKIVLLTLIVVIGAACASPVRGNLGAAHSQYVQKGGWTNPYVTDGLIVMWDGEWNAGGGVHDANATMWVDIIGGATIALSASDCTIGDNSVTTLSGHQITGTISALADEEYSATNCITIEVVFKLLNAPTYSPYVQLGQRAMFTYADTGTRKRTEYGIPNSSSTFLCYTTTQIDSGNINVISFASSVLPSSGMGDNAIFINNVTATMNRRTPGASSSLNVNEIVLGFSTSGSVQLHCIRIYRGAFSPLNVSANYAIDKERFNLP